MMAGDPHSHHAAERMSKDDGRFLHSLPKKAGDVLGVLRTAVSANDSARFTMATEIRRHDVPAEAERRNQRQKNLPAPAKSVEQHERRPLRRTLRIVQQNFTRVKDALGDSGMHFGHAATTTPNPMAA